MKRIEQLADALERLIGMVESGNVDESTLATAKEALSVYEDWDRRYEDDETDRARKWMTKARDVSAFYYLLRELVDRARKETPVGGASREDTTRICLTMFLEEWWGHQALRSGLNILPEVVYQFPPATLGDNYCRERIKADEVRMAIADVENVWKVDWEILADELVALVEKEEYLHDLHGLEEITEEMKIPERDPDGSVRVPPSSVGVASTC